MGCVYTYIPEEGAPFSCWWTKLNDRPEEHVIPLASETNDLKKTTRSHMKRNRGTPPPPLITDRQLFIFLLLKISCFFLGCCEFFLFLVQDLKLLFLGMRHVGQMNRPVMWKRRSSPVRDCVSCFTRASPDEEKVLGKFVHFLCRLVAAWIVARVEVEWFEGRNGRITRICCNTNRHNRRRRRRSFSTDWAVAPSSEEGEKEKKTSL